MMMNLDFRPLKAEEIECRVSTINDYGLTLLLYKDARCDMIILDETVGPMNWQRHHNRDNANCIVAIWDDEKKQWIEKEDVGTESNTEAAKGLASDSFKRACFNWGIGRELYTAPHIFVRTGNYEVKEKNGKPTTYDKFEVVDIAIEEKKIVGVAIRNINSGNIVYTYGKTSEKKSKPEAKQEKPVVITQISKEPEKKAPTLEDVGNELKILCKKFDYNLKEVIKDCNLTKESVLSDYVKAVNYVKGKAIEEGKW